MFEIFICIAIPIIASGVVFWIINYLYNKEPTLDLKGHFKPKRHFFFEKCSKCGKKLKHYHWFWGKGDYMACDVDYHGNTEWYCKECDDEMRKDVIYKEPHL